MDGKTTKSQPDSPVVPSRSTTKPVSTPLSGNHVPPQTQPENSDAHASVEAANANANANANSNVNQPRTAARSLIDRLKECIPKGSNSVLESVVHDRPSSAQAVLRSDSDSIKPSFIGREAVLEQIDKLKPSDRSYLVIDNIDDEWCDALCTRYPRAIDERFILEHMVGSHLMAGAPSYYPAEFELRRAVAEDLKRLDRTFARPRRPAARILGQHIDHWLEAEHFGHDIREIDGCILRPVLSGWTKINRFLSYCRLEDNFCKSIHLRPNISHSSL
jgi:hypothetical protein